MTVIEGLDSHESPPTFLKSRFKSYRKLSDDELRNDPEVIDLRHLQAAHHGGSIQYAGSISSSTMQSACENLRATSMPDAGPVANQSVSLYQVEGLPGKSSS